MPVKDLPTVEIKGYGGQLGLVIHPDLSFEQVEKELIQLLKKPQTQKFFQDSDIFLKENQRTLSQKEFQRLQQIVVQESTLCLSKEMPAFIGKPSKKKPSTESPKTQPTRLDSSKAATKSSAKGKASAPTVAKKDISDAEEKLPAEWELLKEQGWNAEQSVLIRQTLRSGQKIHAKQTVIVMGDVNPGAEIISEQNVIVMGNLRGMVHAGATGNRKAFIAAFRIIPTQLRIAELITQPPKGDSNKGDKGIEAAFVDVQQIVIDSYQRVRL